jgi:outer membrane protein assembly factor BamB/type 1 glutamine amidotransferase
MLAAPLVGLAQSAPARKLAWDMSQDWPQWRGPNRDGIVSDGLPLCWPATGPKLLWKSELIPANLDGGYGSISIAQGRVYVFVSWQRGFRGADGPQDVIVCLDEASGKTLWMTGFPSVKSDHCSGSTPCVIGGKVFVFGAQRLYCLDAKTGRALWQSGVTGAQISSSPLFADNTIFALSDSLRAYDPNGGAPVDLNSPNGPRQPKLLWEQATAAGGPSFEGVPHTSCNCSPAVWRKDGVTYIITCGDKLTCVEAKSGTVRWQAPGPGGASGTPAVSGDYVVINYGIGRGTYAYRMTPEKAEQLWRVSKSDRGTTPIIVAGNVIEYGGGSYSCYDLATGEEKWKQHFAGEISSPIAADGKIFGLYSGAAAMTVFKPTPEKFTPVDNLQIPAVIGSSPAIANGRLYLRKNNCVACYALTFDRNEPIVLPPLAAPAGKPYRILFGSTQQWTDAEGNLWLADTLNDNGEPWVPRQGTLENVNLPRIYQTGRKGLTGFALHLVDGIYTVRGHFCETDEGITEPGLRVMTFSVNGVEQEDIDPFGATGGRGLPLIKQVTTTVKNGLLKIDLVSQSGETLIKALEVLPGELPEPSDPETKPVPLPVPPTTAPHDRGVAMLVGVIDIPTVHQQVTRITPAEWFAGLQKSPLAGERITVRRIASYDELATAMAHPEKWLGIINPYGEAFPVAGPSRWKEMLAGIRQYVRHGGNWYETGGYPFFEAFFQEDGAASSERVMDEGMSFLGLRVGAGPQDNPPREPLVATAIGKQLLGDDVAAAVLKVPCAGNRCLPEDNAHLTLLVAGGRDYVGGYSLGGWGHLWRFGGFNVSPDVAFPVTAAILHYSYTHPPLAATTSDASLMRIEDPGMLQRLAGEFKTPPPNGWSISVSDLQKIREALPDRAKATPAKPRKVMLFCRCEGSQNHWRGILGGNAAFILMGEKTGAFSCVRASEMEAFEPQNLKEFDAIVFNNTTHLRFDNPTYRAALLEFVKSGKGVIGLHAAADCFYDWKEGAEMMGGCAAGHPWMKCAIKLDDPQDPLLAAFGGKGFYIADEMYKIKEPYSRDRLRVLLSFDLSHMSERDASAGREDKDNPVAWIHEFGKGRVFYCNIGHIQQDYFQKPIQEFFLDALQCVLGDLKTDATPSAKLHPVPTPAAAPDHATISNPGNERGDASPSFQEMTSNWPCFRGTGGGLATSTNAPLQWDVSGGVGVLWKAVVPAPGHNSPIVWGDRVFLSGGDKTSRVVFCFHAVKGNLLWQRAVDLPAPPGSQEWKVPGFAGMASPSMVADGHRAYAIFANGDLAAFDFEGKQVWAKNLGLPDNPYGHAASLALWQNRLIVQMDQGVPADHKARLYALDSATGQVIWEKQRPVGSSWSSPIIAEAAGKTQILTLAVPWAIAYDAKDGSELWRFQGFGGEVTPSPIFSAGLFYAISPSETLCAIKPDGRGDITKSHVAWSSDESVPDICSPVSNGELLFTLTTSGVLTCIDAKSGKKQWDHDFEMEFRASPSIAGNRLYLLENTGKVIVLEVNRQFKEVARSDLAEPLYASPAFVSDRIYIRSTKTLFCIGGK